MNITKENVEGLTATIKIELEPIDYQEKYESQLKDYQHKAKVPGFRPGKVPTGMLKKMYGKSVLYEVLMHECNDALINYLRDSDDDLITTPTVNEEKNKQIDLDDPSTFNFYFDIAIAPTINSEIDDSMKVDFYTIAVPEDSIEKYLMDSRMRFGNFEDADLVEEKDMIAGTFDELDANGIVKEGGIKKDIFIYMEQIKDEESKQKLLGKKMLDAFDIDPKKLARNEHELAYFLGLKKDELPEALPRFNLTINRITRSLLAEMNEEFFQKLYPKSQISSEEELREMFRIDLANEFNKDSERKFYDDVVKVFEAKNDFNLPDKVVQSFLKENADEKEMASEITEENLEHAKRQFRWQLIENKIVKENDLYVKEEEIKDFIKSHFRNRVSMGEDMVDETTEVLESEHDHDHDHEHEQEHAHVHEHEHKTARDPKVYEDYLESLTEYYLKDEEQVKEIRHVIYKNKVRDFYKAKLNVVEHTVSSEEFYKILATSNQD